MFSAEPDWDAVYAEELPRVYNFFRYRLGDRPEVEDLTSLTFEKAWRGRHRYRRDVGGFATWLFTIARNVAIDHYRKARREVPLDDHAAGLAAPAASVEEIMDQQARSARLAAMLATLPERERELLALKYGAGMTNRAIARISGLSESNVGTIVHRAVQALRARLPPERIVS